ncbi:dystrophin, isoforms A/C/F/G/H-like [Pollicipes pollicipes]|uniref:dystrophin, isoforms A/C/F/G/H-like n=1 Tax=Pollicipes pollicipes TaxID=41117 RepID=UPI0018856268|nr:dystrophin, isoforms A/C/F/G/H-like [Pollicipes pollicipes]
MCERPVVVGDAEDVAKMTAKHKNVLRELESRKPQLSDLVNSADGLKDDSNRQQVHTKVSQLREGWDQTEAAVHRRLSQLETARLDSAGWEAARAELAGWLGRLETRVDQLPPMGHTADMLEAQIKEQKALHLEVHQYKQRMEAFSQLTQQLIASCQREDTRHIKRTMEQVNQRYSSLNASIIARGKSLHSAVSSLSNFDQALERFSAWMSETESQLEYIDGEVDRLGARQDAQALKTPCNQLKVSRRLGAAPAGVCRRTRAACEAGCSPDGRVMSPLVFSAWRGGAAVTCPPTATEDDDAWSRCLLDPVAEIRGDFDRGPVESNSAVCRLCRLLTISRRP